MDEHDKMKYTDLDKLITEALEDIIRADFTSDDSDDDYVMRALEVIEQRELSDGTAAPIDVDAAWKDFRQIYCTEEGRGQSLYDSREPQNAKLAPQKEIIARKNYKALRLAVKRVGLVAALLALLLAGMFTVQAAGVDIFGAIARWTDEVFHFESTGASVSPDWHDELIAQGVDQSLLPTWIPEGFEAGEATVERSNTWTQVKQPFQARDGQRFHLQIILYSNHGLVGQHIIEKDATNVEHYTQDGRTYYIFSNLDYASGVCLDGLAETSIIGNLSPNNLKQIIDSIGDIR